MKNINPIKSKILFLFNFIRSILPGLLILAAATYGIYWNENREIKMFKFLEKLSETITLIDSSNRFYSEYDGRNIYTNGNVEPKEHIADTLFDIQSMGIKLKRDVEYYQWRENEKIEKKIQPNGTFETKRVYTYELVWSNLPLDSSVYHNSDYRNINNIKTQIDSKTFESSETTMGAYLIPEFITEQLNNFTDLKFSPKSNWYTEIRKRLNTTETISQYDNIIYIGNSINNPDIGDVKIIFQEVLPHEISIIAKLKGVTFEQIPREDGFYSRVEAGIHKVDDMLKREKKENVFAANELRFLFMILCVISFMLTTPAVMDFKPISNFVKTLTAYGENIFAVVAGTAWLTLTIALTRFSLTPVLSIITVLFSITLILVFIAFCVKKKKILVD